MERAGPMRGSRGGALLTMTFVALVLAALAAGAVRLVHLRTAESGTTDPRTQAFYVAEAGISASLAELRARRDADGDGLGTVRGPFAGGAYEVVATETEPDEEWVLDASATLRSTSRRFEVVVHAERPGPFRSALFADLPLKLDGGVFVDSYDSRSGSYSDQATNGQEGPPHARKRADVGSNHDLSIAGKAIVFGDARPGPGRSASVGERAHVSGSTASPPAPVRLPIPSYDPPIPASGPFEAAAGEAATIPGGTHRYVSFEATGGSTVTLRGEVDLYVDGDFRIADRATLVVATGSRVVVHHFGSRSGDPGIGVFEIGGNGLLNQAKRPGSFLVYSATVGDVRLSGEAEFFGAVYAPGARVRLAGVSESYGSLVGREVEVSGDARLHFDEALAEIPGDGPPELRVRSWREVGVGGP